MCDNGSMVLEFVLDLSVVYGSALEDKSETSCNFDNYLFTNQEY